MLASGPLLCSLLTALQVTAVTAGGDGGLKTRVRGIDFAGEGCIGAGALSSSGRHPGNWYGYDETAVDPSRQYNGRVFDSGTGFHDYGARMYWPEIGRFISPDDVTAKLSDPATCNKYSYALDNPYKYTDPDGHCPWCIGAMAGTLVGGIGGAIYSYQKYGEVRLGNVQAGMVAGFIVGGTLGLAAGAAGVGAAGAGVAATAGGGGAAVIAGENAPAAEGAMTTLYRGVMPAELQSIRQTGQFINAGAAEGKYFSTTAEGVSSYAKQAVRAFGDPPYTMVTTKIPASAITPSMQATVDHGIGAVVVPNAMLPSLTPTIQNSMPIPGG